MVHLDINMDLLKQENWGHFHITSNVMFTAISPGFNGGYRIPSYSSEGEINHSSIYDLLIKKRGIGSHNRSFSLSFILSTNIQCPCKDISFFFSVEALKGFPPQQNSDHYLGFNSKLLSILKCSKAFDTFSTSLTHKCIVFVMHISHQKFCKICICYRKKVRKK